MARILSALVIVAVALGLVVVAWPQLLGIQREAIVVQVTTLRGLLAAIAVLLAVFFTLIALIWSGSRRFTGAIALLLLVFAGVQLAVLATRGAGGPGFQTKAPGDLAVVAWNTFGDAPGVESIAELALGADADVLVLPETSAEVAHQVAAAMAVGGSTMQVLVVAYDQIATSRSTAMLIGTGLGEYRIDETAGTTPTLPSVVAVPVDGSGPTLVGAHPVAPVPGEMASWRQGLDWLAERCAGADVIVAGDLNSTLDQYQGLDAASDTTGGLGGCRDAARLAGAAAVGTWPTILPPLLGAPIDHVLATDGWDVVGFRVDSSRDGSGSDHRPVIALLRPSG